MGADASHAWFSVYCPHNGWVDFDPTNDRYGWGSPGEEYVTLAIGRDYADVSPIRGVIHGGAHHTLTVGVTVRPVESGMPTQTQTQSQSQAQGQFQNQGQHAGQSQSQSQSQDTII